MCRRHCRPWTTSTARFRNWSPNTAGAPCGDGKGLDKAQRSMLNLAMISILNRPHELKAHIRGALNNGLTREQIAEVFLQVMIYGGVPAAVDSFRLAREVFAEIDACIRIMSKPIPGISRSTSSAMSRCINAAAVDDALREFAPVVRLDRRNGADRAARRRHRRACSIGKRFRARRGHGTIQNRCGLKFC